MIGSEDDGGKPGASDARGEGVGVREEDGAEWRFAGYLYRLADASYDVEERRGQTLDSLSMQLLTCITILSVAFLTPASFLFSCFDGDGEALTVGQVRLAWMYAVVLIPLAVALLLVLHAQSLKKMSVLASPEDMAGYVREKLNEYTQGEKRDMSELGVAEDFCSSIQGRYKGMERKNDETWKKLRLAMRLVEMSCAAAVLFGIFMLLELA